MKRLPAMRTMATILIAASAGRSQIVTVEPAGLRAPVQRASAGPAASAAAGPAASPDGMEPSLSTVALAVTAGKPFFTAVQLAAPLERAIEASPRMQRLKNLAFDRKPTAILNAWKAQKKDAHPEEDPAAAKKPRKRPEEEKLDRELEAFQRAVTLGNWAEVG